MTCNKCLVLFCKVPLHWLLYALKIKRNTCSGQIRLSLHLLHETSKNLRLIHPSQKTYLLLGFFAGTMTDATVCHCFPHSSCEEWNPSGGDWVQRGWNYDGDALLPLIDAKKCEQHSPCFLIPQKACQSVLRKESTLVKTYHKCSVELVILLW